MRRSPTRPAHAVPRPVLLLLGLALGAQLCWNALGVSSHTTVLADQLAPPPASALLAAASLGEPVALARALMLYVQSADGQRPLAQLDYAALELWLERILALDARGQYPLLAASQVYAAVQDEAKTRRMLAFTYRQFMRDPDRRWPHLAHAALAARHRLGDLALARRYAHALRTATTPGTLPAWAMQLEAFILEDMHERQAARALIGALLSGGQVQDPNEVRFLERRLQQLDAQARQPMR